MSDGHGGATKPLLIMASRTRRSNFLAGGGETRARSKPMINSATMTPGRGRGGNNIQTFPDSRRLPALSIWSSFCSLCVFHSFRFSDSHSRRPFYCLSFCSLFVSAFIWPLWHCFMAPAPCPLPHLHLFAYIYFIFSCFSRLSPFFPALIALSALLDGSAICILPFVKCFHIA